MGSNSAIGNEEPDSFYDFSYEVKREVGSVMDYEVYTGFEDDVNLTVFIELLAVEIMERSPGSDFIFIYGNSTNYDLRNYGTESVYADGTEIVGLNEGAVSQICLEEVCQTVDDNIVDFEDPSITPTFDFGRIASNDILVEIEGNEFLFPLSDYRQVIFIMQKNVGGDRHIVVD